MFLAFALLIAGETPAATPAAQPEKKVCRMNEADTGSIMSKKVCRTKSEWAEIAKANQKNADRYKNDRATGNGVPSTRSSQ